MAITTSEDRQEALKAALSKINKDFGAGSALRLGDKPSVAIQTIPSGFLSMEIALGVPGYPQGRIIEVYGNEGSGKTTLTLVSMAAVQKNGGTAAFIDAEHAFSLDFARAIGVDVENLIFAQPDSGEDALEIAETLIRSNAVDILVIDSVAALVPRKELEGDMGDATMGVQARLMSQGMRKLTAAISKSKTTVFFINQIRQKIGVMFGNPNTTTGGNALKFYASLRIEVARTEFIKDGTDIIGNRTRAKIIKNKIAPPHGIAEYDLMFTKGNEGVSREGDLRDLAVKYNVIKKSGAFFDIYGTKLQGGEKARTYLKQNPEIANQLEAEIKAIVWPDDQPVSGVVAELKAETEDED
jgi:recombination protein RecA